MTSRPRLKHRLPFAAAAAALLLGAGLLGPSTTSAQSQADPEARAGGRAGKTASQLPPAPSASAPTAMVAAANPHATAAGIAALRAGGNAVDAMAAALFVLNVVEPQSSGIGGGGFILVYLSAGKRVVAIDGREEAPSAATPDMFLDAAGAPQRFFPDRITGGNAVGVPGLLLAVEKAVARFGKLGLARSLAPAIRLAEEGFTVSPRLAESLRRHAGRLGRFPATRRAFFAPNGETVAEGTRLRQPDLAATFRLIATEDSSPFYRGAIARDIVRAVRESPVNPGRLSVEDLAGYDAPLRAPVRGTFRGYTLYGMGPPSSGGVTLFQLLALWERAPAPKGEGGPAAAIHRFSQAARLAFADRAVYLADPDFVAVPVEGLLSPGYAGRRAAALDWYSPLVPVDAGRPPGRPTTFAPDRSLEWPSTTHLSVVDAARNMAAVTASVEQAFGSGIVVPGRGFLLNNQLTDFSAVAEEETGLPIANRVEGGRRARRTALEAPEALGAKRPRSSMAPTLVLRDGQPVLTVGSPGGSRIIQFVARVLIATLAEGRSVAEAIAAPHATHLGGRTVLEPPLAGPSTVRALQALGHQVVVAEQNSGLHAIWIDPATGHLHGAADPRREGVARGY